MHDSDNSLTTNSNPSLELNTLNRDTTGNEILSTGSNTGPITSTPDNQNVSPALIGVVRNLARDLRSINLNSTSGTANSPLHVDLNAMRVGTSRNHSLGATLDDTRPLIQPAPEPPYPIPFKAALEFIPKNFDGKNIPVSRFIRDCIYARNSISVRDRQHLFLIIRSRISGSAYNSLLDREIFTLEGLLSHLKNIFTEHRNLSQLNSMLATVAQKLNESVQDYGDRVSEILKNIIELIEEKNSNESAVPMIRSARETACENFIMGLHPRMVLRVRMEKPESLQDAIMAARSAEWEIKYTRDLVKNRDIERRDRSEGIILGKEKSHHGNRFRPYPNWGKTYALAVGRGRATEGDGMSMKGKMKGSRSVGQGRDRGGARSASSQVICRRCSLPGHFERGCAMPPSLDSINCHKCAKQGHFARDCPDVSFNPLCYKCHQPGHYARECNTAGVLETGGKFCKYCKATDHIINDCEKLAKRVADKKKEQKDSLNEL